MSAYASKEEFMGAIKSIVGENSTDEAIAFIENASDTYDSLTKVEETSDSTDWQKKYEENDKQWREKYTARFFSKSDTPDVDVTKTEPEQVSGTQINDLFTEKGVK